MDIVQIWLLNIDQTELEHKTVVILFEHFVSATLTFSNFFRDSWHI